MGSVWAKLFTGVGVSRVLEPYNDAETRPDNSGSSYDDSCTDCPEEGVAWVGGWMGELMVGRSRLVSVSHGG